MPAGIYTRTDEHCKKISIGLIERNKKNPNTGNFKKGHVSFWRGKKLSDQHKEKLRLSHVGKLMHPNTKKALLNHLIGNTHTLGKKLSEETKRKMSVANKGNKHALGSKHTEEWKLMMSIRFRGEKSYMWKGGITPINQQIRGSRKYKIWESKVQERDGYSCKKCGEYRKNKLVAHHILNFATYLDLRFSVENGITFCRRCHGWFHRDWGRKNNTREQVVKFLKDK